MPTKILLINPNKWGRGITTIWLASHSGCLKRSGHNVELFDCTFYKNWTDSEIEINTTNKQFKSSDVNILLNRVKFNEKLELRKKIYSILIGLLGFSIFTVIFLR